MMYSLGTDITILWAGKTSSQAGGQRAGRNVRFSFEDVQAIQHDCRLVKHVTPELARQLPIRSRSNAGLFSTHGVLPVYQDIRSMRLGAGRLLSEADEAEARPVCVLGEEVRKQLFAGKEAVGAEVMIQGIPFKVVGELAKKDQNNSYNGFDGQKVLVPFSVMSRNFPDTRPFVGATHIDNIIFMPISADDHDRALKEVKTVLGRRHGFKPTDEGAIWAWDTVEAARMVATIYDSMELFLSCMAVITLGLGGIGVMNIMLVSVAERTREIGVKQAVGATRKRILLEFFLEALMLTIFSGLAGLVVALGICRLVDALPLPTLFSGLPVTPWTVATAFGTLVLVGILSAIYPARRASLLTPVEALRYE
jgi:putative ABC transport system permease protein